MEKYYCPICGWELEEEYSTGIICPCCGNESEFSDVIEKENADWDKHSKMLDIKERLKKENKPIPKEVIEGIEEAYYSREEAHEILRKKWVSNGCKWKWNDRNERPKDWGIEKAKEQLKNIGVDINELI